MYRLAILLATFLFVHVSTHAQTGVDTLPAIVVKDQGRVRAKSGHDNAKIYAGKSSVEIPQAEMPAVPQNSYRQMLAQVPGLMITEVNNESWASLNFRGLGDPHESYNINMLRDGLPMSADMYGYPGAYYNPPREALESVEFVHGGASLLYGPQPGGALNYRLRGAPVRAEPLRLLTTQTGGSYGLYSTYNEARGASERFGYLVSFHHRRADGFRQNSDYSILNPRVNLNYRPKGLADTVLSFDFDMYTGEHGEPGGLARTAGASVLSLEGDRRRSTLLNDRLEIDRNQATLGWDQLWDDESTSTVKLWTGTYRRASFRQNRSGGVPAFGGVPDLQTNTIQEQRFNSLGLDARWSKPYNAFGANQRLSTGLTHFEVRSPFTEDLGNAVDARGGNRVRELVRHTRSTALFAENHFTFGRLSVVPGARVERIGQSVNEEIGGTGRNKDDEVTVYLGGLGVEYDLIPFLKVYANVSQGFKPVTFAESVPLFTGGTISEDIQPARTLSREVGTRFERGDVYADVNAFWISYDNQLGRVGSNFQNVGSGEHEGVSTLVDARLVGTVHGYVAASWLNARFTGPNLNGRTPMFAPGYMYRSGLRYAYADGSRVQLQAQFVGQHYGDDANTAAQMVPGYTVWDLTGEHSLRAWTGRLDTRLLWGIQNLLDREYFSRVRPNGIEPALPRTFYAGLSLAW